MSGGDGDGKKTAEATRLLEDLWTRFVARHQLSAAERAQLVEAIEGDEIFRRRMINDLQLDGALRAVGDIERGQEKMVAKVKALVTAAGRTEEVVAAVRRRIEAKAAGRAGPSRVAPPRRTHSRAVITGGLLLALGAAAVVLLRPRGESNPATSASAADDGSGAGGLTVPRRGLWGNPRRSAPAEADRALPDGRARIVVAQLEAIEGPVYRHGADGTLRVAAALDLAVGDLISTSGAGARARVLGPGGSRIELVGDVVASFAAAVPDDRPADGANGSDGAPMAAAQVRFFIAHGRATAAVPAGARGPALTLASPHASVSGAGTVRLDVGTAVTRVEVTEGRARVSALGVQRGTDVESGQMALVSGDDLQPPRAQAAREALLLIGPDDTKEEVPPAGLRLSEERLKTRLERLGFQVTVAEVATLTQEKARTATLAVLSSSVASNLLQPWVADLPVPMLVLESTGFEQLGLTGSRWLSDVGPTKAITDITIENAAHPLAAGLSGTVKVLNVPLKMRWGAPLPGASQIATFAGAADQAALLFGYERGAVTAAGPAPARRVGLFLGNGRVIRALTEQGWRLFDAAVAWAAGT
jgi:hypothetical protein